jgi:hypothetical protein
VKECAVLIIPNGASVTRIDGVKKGIFSSWKGGIKAAKLLVPAGNHTIIFKYSNSQDGWSSKNMKCTVAMKATSIGKVRFLVNEGVQVAAQQPVAEVL